MASTVTYLLPIVAIILGFLVLDEHITLPGLAGIVLILAAVAFTWSSTRRAAQERETGAAERSGRAGVKEG